MTSNAQACEKGKKNNVPLNFNSNIARTLSVLTFAIWISFVTVTLSFAQKQSSIEGVVLVQSDQPIEFSTVSVHNEVDSAFVSGSVTDVKGKFVITKLSPGQYYLKVQFLGFKPSYVYGLNLGARQALNIGTVKLQGSEKMLDEVVVTDQPATILHQIDKQVYNVSGFSSAQGGTAIEALRNLPSVSVNAEGEITLRGSSGFIILLDGRALQSDPSVLLSQLPANSIQQIEFVTTPSSKFDPEGKGGIINIITKKGSTDGYSVAVNVQQGLPSVQDYGNERRPLRFGGDITSNIKKGRFNASIAANYKRDDVAGYREGIADTYLNEIHTTFPSLGERSYRNISYGIRGAVSYRIKERSDLEAGLYIGKKSQYRKANILYHQQRLAGDDTELISSFDYFNKNLRERKGDFVVSNVDFKHQLSNTASLLVSALYERTVLGGPTSNKEVNPLFVQEVYHQAYMQEDNPLDGLRIKADYSQSFGDHIRFESGYQYRYLLHRGDFIYSELDIPSGLWYVRPELSNKVSLSRDIHAGYGQLSGSARKLSYSAGLRLEYTDRTLKEEVNHVTHNFRRLNLFPSASIHYELTEDLDLKAGYSRRISHNTSNMMNPFPARRHSEVIEVGDPDLLPEYIGVSEAGLDKHFEKGSVFLNLYHRRVKNVINRVNSVYNDTILYRTYTNAGRANAFGAELGADIKFTKWWMFYGGLNIYHYKIGGSVYNIDVNPSGVNYSVNANTTFSLQPTLILQLNVNYTSRTVTAQGEDSRFLIPTVTLNKTILKGQGNLSFQWQNINLGCFGSNEQRITTQGSGFYASTNYIYEVDVLRLNFAYTFNKLNTKVKFTESEFGEKEF